MMLNIQLSNIDVPLGAALTCQLAGIPFEWGNKTTLTLSPTLSLTSSHSISRHVARLHPTLDLYPSNILHRTEVDHWLTLSAGPLGCRKDSSEVISELNNALAPSTFLASEKLTIADLEVFAALYKSKEWQEQIGSPTCPPHVSRWFNHIKAKVTPYLASLPREIQSSFVAPEVVTAPSASARKDEGKFVELPGAKMGEVVVRFPPEASGYLHIGHAKAALLNQYYQKAFKGKLIMRFDDTNPAKEKADFEKVILEDLKLLEIEPDLFTHTSGHFETMMKRCEDLLTRGLAYVDDTDPETMKKEREERKESRHRNDSVQENLRAWAEMKAGSEAGQRCCVRAKIDMNSPNGCMRDPTIYRCKAEPHVRTGERYKVYPTYDFACPIVDSVEGVTHALRTTEYHDRDEQYLWFLQKLDLRVPHIYEYSRLNMNNTVLSKRKLTWFVDEGLVDGWDDPRFPTVRGIIRRGMTVEGLKEFIVAQGSSRSVVNMEWDKIWAFNKKVIDREAPRYTALEGGLVPVLVKGVSEESKEAQKHPKDLSKGTKTVWVGPKVFIEAVDATELKEGENATFINWGNLRILKVERNSDNTVKHVEAEQNLSNTDFKKTLKVTWLCETPTNAPWTPLVCTYFDHIISKSVLSKEEDFKQFINPNTRRDVRMVGDDALKHLKVGDIIQLQRKGFFRVDETYKSLSAASCVERPVTLIYIPDGHTTKDPTAAVADAKAAKMSPKEVKQSSKGKQAEKSPTEEIRQPIGASSGTAFEIHSKVKDQGDKIRKLKTDKADKTVIMPEVEKLKALKTDFKSHTGVEWTPDIDISQFSSKESLPPSDTRSSTNNALELHNKVKEQGDKIRQLKSDKADKNVIMPEVDKLKSLKADFKSHTGVEWTPDIDISQFSSKESIPAPDTQLSTDNNALELHNKVKEQGDKIRKLKSDKADKNVIMPEVDKLKALKANFKNQTGIEWTPDIDASQFTSDKSSSAVSTTCPNMPVQAANDALNLHTKVKEQGDKIRKLKSDKADKTVIMPEVDKLKALKADFKNHTGIEWTPDIDISQFSSTETQQSSATPTPQQSTGNDAFELHNKVKEQGDRIRKLKSDKADKSLVMAEVDKLKALKADFKNHTGIDWTPDIDMKQFSTSGTGTTTGTTTTSNPANNKAVELHNKVKEQGDKIRKLKNDKADKNIIMPEVDKLKALKTDFKNHTNVEWTPDIDMSQFSTSTNATSSVPSTTSSQANAPLELHNKIKEQGDKVRSLKAAKADKNAVKDEVDKLLSLKKQFLETTQVDWKPDIDINAVMNAPGGGQTKAPPQRGTGKTTKATPEREVKRPKTDAVAEEGTKKQTRLGLEARKEENLSDWYSQVITKAEMIEYYNVSGCYILRPWSYTIWERIKDFFDTKIKALGVENAYFPIFVSKDALEREKTHVADFSPEVAWVTRSGSSEMAEPVAIRPTSETVMYPAFAKWIQSHRDLPIRINQWNNVVRWEFKQPTPFLRTREFLWQEGHTAFATKEEACGEVYTILELYACVYEELLAIPVVRGRKTEKEKFAGADFTTTTEAFVVANGRAIQGATSHHLGQNFSKMFDIVFEDPKTKEKRYVFQNSWGLTTRTIGVMVMVHADNKGLVLPPRAAPVQVVIMPVGITASSTEEQKNALMDFCSGVERDLKEKGIRAKCDFKDNVTPAWKFNHWELKGVPLRIEVGPRELAAEQVMSVRRDTGERKLIERVLIERRIFALLETIHEDMFEKAKGDLDSHKVLVRQWTDFVTQLDRGNIMLAPFCGVEECEDAIKKDSAKDEPSEVGAPSMGAKGLCIPFEQPQKVEGLKCVHPKCSRTPQYFTLFGRSY